MAAPPTQLVPVTWHVPPARLSKNSNRPFWLFVPPGTGLTLIWSKSSSPEYSTWTPALNVWRPLTQVVVFETVVIGPEEEAGYGPPSIVWKPPLPNVTVGILSKISFSWKMYG